jgi:P2-related tail formation protein
MIELEHIAQLLATAPVMAVGVAISATMLWLVSWSHSALVPIMAEQRSGARWRETQQRR